MYRHLLISATIVVVIAFLSPPSVVAQAVKKPAERQLTAEQHKRIVEADKLNAQMIQLYQQGKSRDALPLARQALAIREQTLGASHPGITGSLNNLAVVYDDLGKYAQSLPLYERALAIREKALGPDHPDLA